MTLDWPDGSRPVVLGQFQWAGQGHTVIVTTGVNVVLRSTTTCRQLVVKADRENVGTIFLGNGSMTPDNSATTGGLHLYPGDAVVVPVIDPASLEIGGTAGDGVSYAWFT